MVVINVWRQANDVYANYMEAFEIMPYGSLLAVKSPDRILDTRDAVPLNHVACLAVIARDAFVGQMFTIPSQQPLAFTPEYEDLKRRTLADFDAALPEYDYLLIIHDSTQMDNKEIVLGSSVLSKGFTLYKLH